MAGCGKKMYKAFTNRKVIVFCGDYNEADDYIHTCADCRYAHHAEEEQ